MNDNKNLLVDCMPFHIDTQQINESIDKHGKLIVSGVLQRADSLNQNKRVYPKKILMREVDKYMKVNIAEKRALGELDHPESTTVNLSNVSHNVMELKWKGNDLVGKIEILSTPAGNILKELFKSGIRLGISSRGLGSVEKLAEGDEDAVAVQDDFEILCWDFVSNPSTQGAFMNPLHEGTRHDIKKNKYHKVESVLNNIMRCE
jgi:hypothetical protein